MSRQLPREVGLVLLGALACSALLWAWDGSVTVAWWPGALAIAFAALWLLGSFSGRQGSGRSATVLYRPLNGVLVAAAGLVPPVWLIVLVIPPTGASTAREAWSNRLVRLAALTAAAGCFHRADLPAGVASVTASQAAWALAAPVAYWLTETILLTVIQRLATGSTSADLGMWRPASIARELGEATTGLVIVIAVLVNPVLGLVAVPLIAASASAVLELARSRAADLDRKTGLLNEPAFTYLAARELARAARTGNPVSLLMLDLDHLKRVNDTHGHLAGDTAIIGIADRIMDRMRGTDLACRFGGEEFTVLLPDTDVDGAVAVAERIRVDVTGCLVPGRDSTPVPISVSIGVAQWDGRGSVVELKQSADDALYLAKGNGRNRVVAATTT